MMLDQLNLDDLLPDSPPNASTAEVPLDDLPTIPVVKDRHFHELVDSIRLLGLLCPLVLESRENGYDVIAGRRRLAALRELGIEQAACRIYEPAARFGAVAGLADNAIRSDNFAAELDMIERLMAGGAGISTISKITGIPTSTIKRRLKLANLIGGLREALDKALISGNIAESIAGLSTPAQERLLAILRERGSLTSNDVREERRVKIADSTPTLAGFEVSAEATEEDDDGEPLPDGIDDDPELKGMIYEAAWHYQKSGGNRERFVDLCGALWDQVLASGGKRHAAE